VNSKVKAFLAEPRPAVIGTRRRDDSVALNPVWFEYRDDALWLNSYTSAQWPRRVIRDRTATLLVIDLANMLRRVQMVCTLESIDYEGGREHIDRLARRYLGAPYRGPHQERLILRLTPTHVFAELG
jgi:hypothetical protein